MAENGASHNFQTRGDLGARSMAPLYHQLMRDPLVQFNTAVFSLLYRVNYYQIVDRVIRPAVGQITRAKTAVPSDISSHLHP